MFGSVFGIVLVTQKFDNFPGHFLLCVWSVERLAGSSLFSNHYSLRLGTKQPLHIAFVRLFRCLLLFVYYVDYCILKIYFKMQNEFFSPNYDPLLAARNEKGILYQ